MNKIALKIAHKLFKKTNIAFNKCLIFAYQIIKKIQQKAKQLFLKTKISIRKCIQFSYDYHCRGLYGC